MKKKMFQLVDLLLILMVLFIVVGCEQPTTPKTLPLEESDFIEEENTHSTEGTIVSENSSSSNEDKTDTNDSVDENDVPSVGEENNIEHPSDNLSPTEDTELPSEEYNSPLDEENSSELEESLEEDTIINENSEELNNEDNTSPEIIVLLQNIVLKEIKVFREDVQILDTLYKKGDRVVVEWEKVFSDGTSESIIQETILESQLNIIYRNEDNDNLSNISTEIIDIEFLLTEPTSFISEPYYNDLTDKIDITFTLEIITNNSSNYSESILYSINNYSLTKNVDISHTWNNKYCKNTDTLTIDFMDFAMEGLYINKNKYIIDNNYFYYSEIAFFNNIRIESGFDSNRNYSFDRIEKYGYDYRVYFTNDNNVKEDIFIHLPTVKLNNITFFGYVNGGHSLPHIFYSNNNIVNYYNKSVYDNQNIVIKTN